MDDQPVFIRIASNAVLEPWFTPACSFDELLQALLDAPPPNETTEALIPVYHSMF
ncbi:hypothetical protein [Hymenobacter lapidarius]|uniref:hypothetical protein n=1 Tax=Hymenobacter lapidarius TaxID=1908237 RepID=UPI0013018FC6|nr:hypothetical protein [Hymenobacter lapidarius]